MNVQIESPEIVRALDASHRKFFDRFARRITQGNDWSVPAWAIDAASSCRIDLLSVDEPLQYEVWVCPMDDREPELLATITGCYDPRITLDAAQKVALTYANLHN